jgi:hypothetical protein
MSTLYENAQLRYKWIFPHRAAKGVLPMVKPKGERQSGARGPARFKEREVARAVRAARSAGGVARVEIAEDGKITLVLTTKDGEEIQADAREWTDEIDKLKSKAPKARGR